MGGTPDGDSPKGLFGVHKLLQCLHKGLRKYSFKAHGKTQDSRNVGKKGSKAVIGWYEAYLEAFEAIKKVLCESLILKRVNPDKTFILRVDASKYAVGAALEQLLDEERCPTKEDVLNRKNVPVAFMPRKLTGSQRNWVPRDQKTYASFWPYIIGKVG